MLNLRSRFALLALAVTSSAAFAQFTYQSNTYAEASAFGNLDVPGPYGINTNVGNSALYYGAYASAQWNTLIYAGMLGSGFQGGYGQDTGFSYGFNLDSSGFIYGLDEAESGGNLSLGQYQYSSICEVQTSAITSADFTIATGGFFDFSAYGLYTFGLGNDNEVYLENVMTSSFLWSMADFNGVVTWSGYLAPGEYDLVGEAQTIYGNFFSVNYPGGYSSVEYGFAPAQTSSTPGPLAALPFAVGALLRRRRR